ncbi:putative uncharacterized protein DDB_G0271982 [Cajanus cajan]|uniref:putative uncharacterized protein DDB_G0271982 n=1 Tax=Cajanus cajan TaxID=3821 RepID=UPI00098D85F6|nr:putative uncharacterized protein DDB_G0271982 [Cajanus cajan]
MEREEERERRRVRDRQRRQSMTKEQRERHLARRRRNYQLRRQRAANAPFMSLPQIQSSNTPPSTSSHLHPSSQGSSIQFEGFPTSLRLNIIKRLARNLATTTTVPPATHQVATNAHGTTSKPLRLNRVKRLARSLSFPSENTQVQNNHNGTGEVNGESLEVVTS